MSAHEHAKFWHDSTLSNLELLHATYVTHSFAPHTHEGYVIGVIEHGAEQFEYRKSRHDFVRTPKRSAVWDAALPVLTLSCHSPAN